MKHLVTGTNCLPLSRVHLAIIHNYLPSRSMWLPLILKEFRENRYKLCCIYWECSNLQHTLTVLYTASSLNTLMLHTIKRITVIEQLNVIILVALPSVLSDCITP